MKIMDINENTLLRPGDFTCDRYYGMGCFNRKGKSPVILLMSRSSEPPHWRVMNGTSQLFFLTHKEALDYCKRSGCL